MPAFRYKAMTASGRTVGGRMHAEHAADLEARINRLGMDLIAAAPATPTTAVSFRPSRRDLANLCFHLAQLLDAGVPIVEALADLRDSVDDPRLRTLLATVLDAIRGGKTLSEALAEQQPAFDEVTVNLIQAGETSGRLTTVLGALVDSLKWQDELAAQTWRLAAYPAFLSALVLALTVFVMSYLVPMMTNFVQGSGGTLPWHTRLLIATSAIVATWWPLLLAVPLFLASLLKLAARRHFAVRLALDRAKLKLPVGGEILRKVSLARFASALALMYASGIAVLDALAVGARIAGNAAIAEGMRKARERIAEGSGVAEAFERTGTFPPLVVRMLHVGESSGGLDAALENVAYFYLRDVRESIERAQAIAEPALTVVIGLVIGWILLSVLGPIYDAIGALRI